VDSRSLWYRVLVARYNDVGESIVDRDKGGPVWWNDLNNIRGGVGR